MRRKIRRSAAIAWQIIAAISFIFSVVCTFLGVAPDRAIIFIVGPEWVARLQYVRAQVLGMTSEQGRWVLVILGDLSFAVAVLLFVFVYYANKMAKIYTTAGELSDTEIRLRKQIEDTKVECSGMIATLEEKAETQIKKAREQLAEARKKERTARTLHNNAHKMLEEIRQRKTGKS
jgi:hypothetical protein